MSSETRDLQQLYEAEKLRRKTLERTVARLEAENEQASEQAKERIRAQAIKLDGLQVESEMKDEQLKAKDVIIERLQIAFKNADRPVVSGDDTTVKDLQATIDRLKGYNVKVIEVAKATSVKDEAEISSLKVLIEEQQGVITVQKWEFDNLLAECEDALTAWRESSSARQEIISAMQSQMQEINSAMQSQMQEIQSQMQELHSETQAQARVRNSTLGSMITQIQRGLNISRKFIAARSVPEPDLITGDVELQPSKGASNSAPASQSLAKVTQSPAELEVLRLKDRLTLHSLTPR